MSLIIEPLSLDLGRFLHPFLKNFVENERGEGEVGIDVNCFKKKRVGTSEVVAPPPGTSQSPRRTTTLLVQRLSF